jgi:hypothetical protein
MVLRSTWRSVFAPVVLYLEKMIRHQLNRPNILDAVIYTFVDNNNKTEFDSTARREP